MREIQSSMIKQINTLYNQGSYLEVVKKADELLGIIGEPQNTDDALRYSFETPEEFLMYVELHRQSNGKQVIWTESQTSHVLAQKAAALYELKKHNEAINALSKAIRFNPVNTHYKFELIENLFHLQDFDRAEVALRLLLKEVIYPEDVARLYRRLGFYYTEIKKYNVAIACYVWSMRFEQSDNAMNELLYIRSLRPDNDDPEHLVETTLFMTDLRVAMENLRNERLLLFFLDFRKDFLLNGSNQKTVAAAKLYKSMGLILDDRPTQAPESNHVAEPIHESKERAVRSKIDSFKDFLNKYKK